MATEIDAARLLIYRAAWLKQEGRPHAVEGAKAKLFASEMARRRWTAEAIQVLGGYGYTKEFPVERFWSRRRSPRSTRATSEIQRFVIARSILGASCARTRFRREPRRRTMPRERDEPVRLTKIWLRAAATRATSPGRLASLEADGRIAAYGTVDELNSVLGLVVAGDSAGEVREVLVRVQNELFIWARPLGSARISTGGCARRRSRSTPSRRTADA